MSDQVEVKNEPEVKDDLTPLVLAVIEGTVTSIPTRLKEPEVASRVCARCSYVLPLEYFGAINSKTCDLCRGILRQARPWTEADLVKLVAAARAILDLWPKYFDHWSEEDLVLWRELVTATGREGV